MPLDKFVLILCIVFVATGVTVWIGASLSAAASFPLFGLGMVPLLLIAAVVWRVIHQRLNNPEDDHYDQIEK